MPFGTFLDTLPAAVFIVAHVFFPALGVWAARAGKAHGAGFASALWLYVVSQVVFLAFFGGAITMKTAVLVEQTCVALLVLAVTLRPKST